MPHKVGSQCQYPNLLQIWQVSNFSKDVEKDNIVRQDIKERERGGVNDILMNSASLLSSDPTDPSLSNTLVSLAYCIGLTHSGPCWKVAWSPWTPSAGGEKESQVQGIGLRDRVK